MRPKELDSHPNKPKTAGENRESEVENEVEERVLLGRTCHDNCPFQERKNIKARVRGPYGFELVFGVIRVLDFFLRFLNGLHSVIN